MSDSLNQIVENFNERNGTNYRLGSVTQDGRTYRYVETYAKAGIGSPNIPDDDPLAARQVEVACRVLLQHTQGSTHTLASVFALMEDGAGEPLGANAADVLQRQISAYHQIVAAMHGYEDPSDAHDAIAAIIEDEESRREDLI